MKSRAKKLTGWMVVLGIGFVLQYGGIACAYRLPDTGQVKCYNGTEQILCPNEGEAFYGQDAQYQGNPPSFQDNGDGTVSDLNTGLMWQQGDEQNPKGAGRTWQKAIDYCESLEQIGNCSKWRLPTRRELFSIVDYGRTEPAIDPHYFPECRSYDYWSGSTDAYHPINAWHVGFYDGNDDWGNKDYSFYVRCVCAGS